MAIFIESNEIVKAVEAHLVANTDSSIPVIEDVKRLIWLPTKFLKIGVDEKRKGTTIWALLSFGFMMLGIWLVKDLETIKSEIFSAFMLVTMIVPLFLVTFAMPSIYGHSGVSQKSVEFVVKHLHYRGFKRANDVDLLKKSIKPFEERCRSRVNVLKWLVGLLWASFTYTFSKGIEHSIATPSELISYVFVGAFMLMGIIIAYLCVWGYDAALDKLFRAIEFGCNDFCYLIDAPSSTHG